LFSLGRDSKESQDSEKTKSDKKVRFLEDNAVNNTGDEVNLDEINATGNRNTVKRASKQNVSFSLPDENNESSNNSYSLDGSDSDHKRSNLSQRKGTPAPKSTLNEEKNVRFNDNCTDNQSNISRIGTPYYKAKDDDYNLDQRDLSHEKNVRFNDNYTDNQSNISRIGTPYYKAKAKDDDHQGAQRDLSNEKNVRSNDNYADNQSKISRISTPYPKAIDNKYQQDEKTVRFDNDYNNKQSNSRIGTPYPSKPHQDRTQQPEDISENYHNDSKFCENNTSQYQNQKNVTFDDIDLTYKTEFSSGTPSPYARKDITEDLSINDRIQSRISTPHVKDRYLYMYIYVYMCVYT
jgi:hypothetical protein